MRLTCSKISPETEAELLSVFPAGETVYDENSDDEILSEIALKFPPEILYNAAPGGRRDGFCSVCGTSFRLARKYHKAFFAASCRKGKNYARCPACRTECRLISWRKCLTDGQSGKDQADFHPRTENFVRLYNHGDWLLADAGLMRRMYHAEYFPGQYMDDGSYQLSQNFTFTPVRLYAFRMGAGKAPGVRVEWIRQTLTAWGNPRRVNPPDGAPEWKRASAVADPFPGMMYQTPSYAVINFDALDKSPLRYCQYDRWIDITYGGGKSGNPRDWYKYLFPYLGIYVKTPGLEMLVKSEIPGIGSVIADYVSGVDKNGAYDWKAKNPADFLRLSKSNYKIFRAENLSLPLLADFRRISGMGLVRDLPEYLRIYRQDQSAFRPLVDALGEMPDMADITLAQGLRYIQKQAAAHTLPAMQSPFPRQATAQEMARQWRDYLQAAAALQYDLSRRDTLCPRDLTAAHDAAVAARQIQASADAERKYKPIRTQLTKQFAFSRGGLTVRIPSGAEEIIAEGRTLKHCVGGYAARHCTGQCIILFLRRADDYDTPYATIELIPSENPEKIMIAQIHGYANDKFSPDPKMTHADFLSVWLDWIHAGSPRDLSGNPAIAAAQNAAAQTVTSALAAAQPVRVLCPAV